MAKLNEILGDSYESLPEDVKTKYKDTDLVDSSKYVDKTKYDEVEKEKKQLETDIKDRNDQLENLKKSTGDNEELKKQIETLQADNKKKDEDHSAEMKELKLTNAIKLSIANDAQDVDLVTTLIDKSKIIHSEDGQMLGLDEQIKTLKENKSFLFKAAENDESKNDGSKDNKNPFFTTKTDTQTNNKETGTFKSALHSALGI